MTQGEKNAENYLIIQMMKLGMTIDRMKEQGFNETAYREMVDEHDTYKNMLYNYFGKSIDLIIKD